MLGAAHEGVSRPLMHELPLLASSAAIEAGWIAAHLVMYPLGFFADTGGRSRRHDLHGLSTAQRSLVHLDVNAATTPILLVHGIVDNHSIFTVLGRALRRRGFSAISSFDYGVLTRDVRRTAGDLAAVVERLTIESGYDRVHLVGHSLGGLIARYYVQRMGGDRRVHTLVTIASPHGGTELARVGSLLPLVRQLRPDSDLIREFAQPAAGCTTRFVAFYSDLDQLILPSANGRIRHPDLAARNIAVHGVGHLSMPHHAGVAQEIAAVLRALDP